MHKLHSGCDYRVREHHQLIQQFRVIRHIWKAYMFRLRRKIRCITVDQLNLLIVRTAVCRHIIVVIQIVACGNGVRCIMIIVACICIDQFVRCIIITAAHAICDGIDRWGLENSICWMLKCYGATCSTPISGHRGFRHPNFRNSISRVGIFLSLRIHLLQVASNVRQTPKHVRPDWQLNEN